MIKSAITRRDFTWILLKGATRGTHKNAYEPHISLKERPAEGAYGNPKRRISEIMSDQSLSSVCVRYHLFVCDHSHMAFSS